MDYEDNAQYYLIWAVLMKRAGGTVNDALVRKAYEFIRQHEKDGLYVPPPLPGSPNPKGWKTYHDVLLYDEDDSPASNQGFHCGALLAAKELGLDVTETRTSSARLRAIDRCSTPSAASCPPAASSATRWDRTPSTARR